jgi:hypothetical protein
MSIVDDFNAVELGYGCAYSKFWEKYAFVVGNQSTDSFP